MAVIIRNIPKKETPVSVLTVEDIEKYIKDNVSPLVSDLGNGLFRIGFSEPFIYCGSEMVERLNKVMRSL